MTFLVILIMDIMLTGVRVKKQGGVETPPCLSSFLGPYCIIWKCALRFFAQAASLCPGSRGFSFP